MCVCVCVFGGGGWGGGTIIAHSTEPKVCPTYKNSVQIFVWTSWIEKLAVKCLCLYRKTETYKNMGTSPCSKRDRTDEVVQLAEKSIQIKLVTVISFTENVALGYINLWTLRNK
jgi:hypothetical protein